MDDCAHDLEAPRGSSRPARSRRRCRDPMVRRAARGTRRHGAARRIRALAGRRAGACRRLCPPSAPLGCVRPSSEPAGTREGHRPQGVDPLGIRCDRRRRGFVRNGPDPAGSAPAGRLCHRHGRTPLRGAQRRLADRDVDPDGTRDRFRRTETAYPAPRRRGLVPGRARSKRPPLHRRGRRRHDDGARHRLRGRAHGWRWPCHRHRTCRRCRGIGEGPPPGGRADLLLRRLCDHTPPAGRSGDARLARGATRLHLAPARRGRRHAGSLEAGRDRHSRPGARTAIPRISWARTDPMPARSARATTVRTGNSPRRASSRADRATGPR